MSFPHQKFRDENPQQAPLEEMKHLKMKDFSAYLKGGKIEMYESISK